MVEQERACHLSKRIADYNNFIRQAAAKKGVPVVDVAAIFAQLAPAGKTTYQTPDLKGAGIALDASFAGGLFSYDAIHPSSTGHAAIGNEFINVINAQLKKVKGWGGINQNIDPLNVLEVLKKEQSNPKSPNRQKK